MRTHRLVGLLTLVLLPICGWAAQTDIAGPAGSGAFGTTVTVLPNGNFVVTDPLFDAPGPVNNVGAVHLYSPTGVLISTLTGSTANDMVGGGQVRVLGNGNFVVHSPNWNNGAATSAGAVTWGSGTTGFPGGAVVTVSDSNSLVGDKSGDQLGNERVTVLSNSNYVLYSRNWDNGAAVNAGAVTWGNGTTGTSGVVSDTNSLVGSTGGDLDNCRLIVLPNGHYVVSATEWDNGTETNAGSVTWANGTTGITGAISGTNSLVGSTAGDRVGNGGVHVLANGNYIVRTEAWDNGMTADVGAVTWGNGASGISGPVTDTNSLVGATPGDLEDGDHAILANGHYVVGAQNWDNGPSADVGAAVWINGTTGLTGTIVPAIAMIGSTPDDRVGADVEALTNGHYVIGSPFWDNGAANQAGAATWCNGTTSTTGVVSAANSLVGTTSSNQVGVDIFPLTNGNYVVGSPQWDNGALSNVGAATWGNGSTGTSGAVGAANSLIGSKASDRVGASVQALANGNYVVRSGEWDNGAAVNAGAVTWGNGTTGIVGAVSAANSLVGSTAGDSVGLNGVTALTNGNYVVSTSSWDNGAVASAGAVTWGNGTTGISGVVSAANSLVGSATGDQVGNSGVTALTNGHYIVRSKFWDNPSPAAADAGAVTWGNGTTGTVGAVSAANSLVGSTPNDQVGSGGVTALTNGNYVVNSWPWDNGEDTDAGAVTLGNGSTGTSGAITSANSVLGTVSGAGANFVFSYDVLRERLVVGRRNDNLVTLMSEAGSVSFSSTLYTVTEASLTANITINRTGGTDGAASVTFQTTPGTATIGAAGDYLAIAPQVVNFADGQASATVQVTISPGNAANEPNETFGVTLSNPVGVTLGSTINATVRIIDAGDTTVPGAPVISTPAANALVGVNAGGTLNVTGTAADGKGIALVEVQLNGGAFVPATLTSMSGTSANWTATITPRTGTNTINVRSTDTSGNVSTALATRSFRVARPLLVQTSGTGTVTAGFSPTSFREVGKSFTITATAVATPAPGTIFTGWTVTGPNLAQMGLAASALEKPTLTFIFREGLQLVAGFVPNPYVPGVAGVTGTYNGLIKANAALPDRTAPAVDGTLPGNSTEGHFTATVQNTGGFSGKLKIDGTELGVAGAFDHQGRARFGTARLLTLTVARVNKPSLFVKLDIGGPVGSVAPAGKITGQVSATEFKKSTIAAVSDVSADRAHFTGLAGGPIVPDDYLTVTGSAPTPTGRADGNFTVVLPAVALNNQPQRIIDAGYTTGDYPQGDGIGTIKVSKAGLVTFTGTLADGTPPVTASGTLSQDLRVALFVPLYTSKGFLSALVQLNSGDTDSDLKTAAGGEVLWSRPTISTSHYYPHGWAEVIEVGFMGAKYAAVAGQSVLKAANGVNIQLADEDGNAALAFSDGQLSETLNKPVNLSTADAVTKPADYDDPTFTLMITRTTGAISGMFDHTDDTKPTYTGIIYQKGPNAGAYGFFLTKQPVPIDYTGESGGVSLIGQP